MRFATGIAILLCGTIGAVSLARGQGAAPLTGPQPYLCDGTQVDLQLGTQTGLLRIGGVFIPVAKAGQDTLVSTAPPEVTITLRDPDPQITFPAGDVTCRADGSAAQAGFVARGNEPPWRLILRNGHAELRRGYEDQIVASGPAIAALSSEAEHFAIGQSGYHVQVHHWIARDSMSGLPAPARVTVTGPDDTLLQGTGGLPSRLVEGVAWRVLALSEQPLPAELVATLRMEAGQISGSTGCNRVLGMAEVTGEGLRFKALGGTRRLCAPPVMAMERALLDALHRVTGHDFNAAGDLILLQGPDPILRLRPELLVP